MSEENSIYVGSKPVMNYVLACITLFHNGKDEVTIKARGRSISRAVDVAEIVRNRFMSDVYPKEIRIGTETINTETGNPINVSTIEIVLAKK
ncbi:MAG: DNA-binding protein Alba [Candidatus Freyarchaeota archaeon]|nr:DNA-binding protein Alba [Candidatus Freyrarchaeum guaymaensis]